jgi:hypothetical protein
MSQTSAVYKNRFAHVFANPGNLNSDNMKPGYAFGYSILTMFVSRSLYRDFGLDWLSSPLLHPEIIGMA